MHDLTTNRSQAATRSASVLRPLLIAGALLGAAALVVRARVRRVEREHPPTGRFIDVDGVRLHYVERGRGEAIVLLHGNGTMALDFVLAGTLDAAAQRGYRAIAFDRPGFGYSTRPAGRRWTPQAQADLLAAALRRLGIERVTVLGHSWGTLVALAMAHAYPERVRRLVLVSGYYFPTPRLDALLLSPPALPLIGTLMRHTISPLLGRLIWRPVMRRMFGPREVPPSFAAYPKWLSLRPGQLRASAAESAGMIPAAWRLQHHYGELKMPVTIVAGTHDRQASAMHQSARLHDVIAGSTLTLVPGQGHMLQHLAPEVIEAALREDASAAQVAARVDQPRPAPRPAAQPAAQ
jgi:pimeloyl-ACP methyl ester carboxylesterase